jgi:hypothetical protein
LTICAFLLGFAIQVNFGQLDAGAIFLLMLALPLAVIGVLRPDWRLWKHNVQFALGAVLTLQFGLLALWPPGAGTAVQDATVLIPFRVGLIAAATLSLWEVFGRSALAGIRLPMLLGFWAVSAAWVISLSPLPHNDVWWFQQTASEALLNGVSPYAIQMPNIYAPDTSLYAPGIVSGDRLDVGLPYPPLSLLIGMPGFLLFHDVRFAHLLVVVIAAAVIAAMRSDPISRVAALVFLFTPRGFFVIEQGWTEPQAALAVALVVLLLAHQSHVIGPVVGLAMGVKQHLALLLPIVLLQLDWRSDARRALKIGGIATATFLIVIVPFVLWDADAFWRSVVELQFLQPFRDNALSLPALFGMDDPRIALLGFASLIPAGFFVWRYGARTPAGYAAAVALIYLVFFMLNKQAFANYYYFVIGAMCCAIAAIRPQAAGSA